ncbi:MAG TPA: CvpA family protein [Micropepsaceae bacterium]
MSALSLTAIDFVVIAVVLLSAIFATARGLIHETFAILAWIAGGYLAFRLTPFVQPLLHNMIAPPWLERFLVLLGIFILVFVPLAIFSRWLSAKVKGSVVSPVDHVLGLVFGVCRGLVIVGVAYIAFAALVPLKNQPDILTKARLFPVIRNTSEMLRELVPSGGTNLSSGNSASGYGARGRSTLDRLLHGKPENDSSSQ